ncbi:MATH domain and coiled-coil domain-containing protein At3g58360-like [Arachis duranensis]|uniref:MATH domain and coiled-coil domain-containing protein At3g58360-like n=1 Tax=Arachis duranensis TaxID=130453 RepID=A0A6P4CHG5_ARADU|nr:MATH domain and coiled-coil domain-containing protein At3g58360-like [Arachis duranensis]
MEDQKATVETIVKFTWTINNFSEFNCKMLKSDTFFAGSHPWRILVFYPEGENDEDEDECNLEICLDAGHSANLPDYWNRYASLKLFLINQVDDKMTITDSLYEGFHKHTVECGCILLEILMDIDKFRDSKNGFLVNDTCIIVAEVSLNNNASIGRELIDFKGVAKIEKDYVELLEKACSKHPSLIEGLLKRNRSQRFIELGFTALGRVLHFLKTKKVKDMMNDDAACKELQDLWDEVEIVRFDDLTWLEPHVKSALRIKVYKVKEEMVTKLKGSVVDLEDRVESLKANVAAAKDDLEGAKMELAIAEKGFVKKDLNDELSHGIPYL